MFKDHALTPPSANADREHIAVNVSVKIGILFVLMWILAACSSAAVTRVTTDAPLTQTLTGNDRYDTPIRVAYPEGWYGQATSSGMLFSNVELGDAITLQSQQMIVHLDFWSIEDVPYFICIVEDDRLLPEHVVLSVIVVPARDNPVPMPYGDPHPVVLGDERGAMITQEFDIGVSMVLAIEKAGGYAILSTIAMDVDADTQREMLYTLASAVEYRD